MSKLCAVCKCWGTRRLGLLFRASISTITIAFPRWIPIVKLHDRDLFFGKCRFRFSSFAKLRILAMTVAHSALQDTQYMVGSARPTMHDRICTGHDTRWDLHSLQCMAHDLREIVQLPSSWPPARVKWKSERHILPPFHRGSLENVESVQNLACAGRLDFVHRRAT